MLDNSTPSDLAKERDGLSKCQFFDFWIIERSLYSFFVTRVWSYNLGQIGTGFIQNGTNPHLLSQIVLKSDMKNSRICPIWGQSDPLWGKICGPCWRVSGQDEWRPIGEMFYDNLMTGMI